MKGRRIAFKRLIERTDGDAVTIVGTYKDKQLAWIKRYGVYNYPVKEEDELKPESCAKVKELADYLPSDLAKLPREQLRVCEAAVQLYFWNMPNMKMLEQQVPSLISLQVSVYSELPCKDAVANVYSFPTSKLTRKES